MSRAERQRMRSGAVLREHPPHRRVARQLFEASRGQAEKHREGGEVVGAVASREQRLDRAVERDVCDLGQDERHGAGEHRAPGDGVAARDRAREEDRRADHHQHLNECCELGQRVPEAGCYSIVPGSGAFRRQLCKTFTQTIE